MTSEVHSAVRGKAARRVHGMPGPLSLRTNVLWTLSGNVVHAGARWVMLIVLAKSGGASMVGQFALGLAIVEPMILFSDLQLRAVLATDAKRESPFSNYLSLRVVMCALALAVAIGVAFAAGYPAHMVSVIAGVALWKVLDSVSDLFHGLFQQRERMDRVARSLIAKGLLALAALGIAVRLTGDLLWGLVGLIATVALILLLYDLPNGSRMLKGRVVAQGRAESQQSGVARWLRWRSQMPALIKLAWLALPLGVTMMLIALGQNVPRYVIEWHFGESELGVFAGMVYLIVVGNTAVAALGHAASPRLARYYLSRDRAAFRALLAKLVASGAVLGAAGVGVALVAGQEILTLIYESEFAQNVEAFAWVMLAGGIGYVASCLGFGITATRQFKRFTVPYLGVAIVSACASALLVPSFGLVGAAWALCLVNLTSCLVPIMILSTSERTR